MNMLNRISFCKTAKDIWHTLEVTHWCTNLVNISDHVDHVHDNEDFVTEPLIVDQTLNGEVSRKIEDQMENLPDDT